MMRATLMAVLLTFSGAQVGLAQEDGAWFFNGGFTLGGTAAQVRGDGIEGFNKLGLHGGAVVEVRQFQNLGFQLGLLYNQKGSRKVQNPKIDDYTNWGYKFTYIDIPLTAVYDFKDGYTVGTGLQPGVLIGAVFKLTVKEPPRGYTDPHGTKAAESVSLQEAIRELTTKPAFWYMTAGATVAAFCGYGISSFQSIFLVRSHGITTGEAAIWINAPVSLSSAVGTFATGWLATKLYQKHPGAIAWVPGIGLALSVPFYVFAFTTDNLLFAAISLIVAGFVKYGYLAAQYTIGQGVVTMRVRAMATAVLLFVANLIGYGFGPLFIGAISDIFFVSGAAELGVAAEELARNQCHPRAIGELSENLQNVCGEVYSQSLQSAMVIMALLYTASSLFFLLTWRRLDKDMVDRNPG